MLLKCAELKWECPPGYIDLWRFEYKGNGRVSSTKNLKEGQKFS